MAIIPAKITSGVSGFFQKHRIIQPVNFCASLATIPAVAGLEIAMKHNSHGTGWSPMEIACFTASSILSGLAVRAVGITASSYNMYWRMAQASHFGYASGNSNPLKLTAFQKAMLMLFDSSSNDSYAIWRYGILIEATASACLAGGASVLGASFLLLK